MIEMNQMNIDEVSGGCVSTPGDPNSDSGYKSPLQKMLGDLRNPKSLAEILQDMMN